MLHEAAFLDLLHIDQGLSDIFWMIPITSINRVPKFMVK